MSKNVPGRFVRRLSAWRRIATATWNPPGDPTIYGMLEVDATKALELLGARNAGGAPHVTITHLVAKIIADTFAEHPECNAYVRLGRVYERASVDVFVLVAVPPEEREHEQAADLSGVKVLDADKKSLAEIAEAVRRGARRVRKGKDELFGPIKRVLASVPTAALKAGLKAVELVQYDLNIDASKLSVPRDSFGCAVVTSVGMMGLKHVFPPLIPMSRVSALIAVGAVEERPVARDGQVVIRPMLPLTATFDHRIIDGFQGAQLAKTFQERMSDPARYYPD